MISTGARQPVVSQNRTGTSNGGAIRANRFVIKGNGNTNENVDQNDDWQLVSPGDDLLIQRMEADVWTTKQNITP